MSTAPPFDPYREWLGIEPHDQPADYYRLLGLARFEADTNKIAAAADGRMAMIRSFQMGPRGMYTQKLLNELAAARVTLLTPQSRSAYDQALLQHRPPAAAAARAAFAPMFAAPAAQPFMPVGAAQLNAPPVAAPPTAAPPVLSPPRTTPLVTVRPVAPPQQSATPASQEEADAAEAAPRSGRPLLLLMLMLGVPALILLAVIAWGTTNSYFARAAKLKEQQAAEAAEKARREAPPPKAETKAIVVLQEGSGEVLLTPATAARHGAIEVGVSGTEEVLIDWTDPQSAAEWRFKLIKPGFFKAEVTYATAEGVQGAELELAIDEQKWPLDLSGSGALNAFTTESATIVVRKSGENTITVRPGQHPDGDWLVLKSVRLMPLKRDLPAEVSE